MSTIKCEIIGSMKDVGTNEWNELVNTCKMGSFFHRYEWLDAIERSGEGASQHIIVRKNDCLIGVFPNFVSKMRGLPFKKACSIMPSHGGPLIIKEEENLINLFLSNVDKICKGRVVSHEIYFHDSPYTRYGCLLRKKQYRPSL